MDPARSRGYRYWRSPLRHFILTRSNDGSTPGFEAERRSITSRKVVRLRPIREFLTQPVSDRRELHNELVPALNPVFLGAKLVRETGWTVPLQKRARMLEVLE